MNDIYAMCDSYSPSLVMESCVERIKEINDYRDRASKNYEKERERLIRQYSSSFLGNIRLKLVPLSDDEIIRRLNYDKLYNLRSHRDDMTFAYDGSLNRLKHVMAMAASAAAENRPILLTNNAIKIIFTSIKEW